MAAILAQLNISAGGMPKLPMPRAQVTREGVTGDWQKNRKYHGGPDRAICLYSEELYTRLRAGGVDLENGQIGENFTTRGLDLMDIGPGDRLKVGACLIEITMSRTPCRNLNRWHPALLKRIKGQSGWLAKVIEEAVVAAGDPIELIPKEGSDR